MKKFLFSSSGVIRFNSLYLTEGSLSDLLQKVEVEVLTDQECKQKMGSLRSSVNADVHICVFGRQDGGAGACNVRIPIQHRIYLNYMGKYSGPGGHFGSSDRWLQI